MFHLGGNAVDAAAAMLAATSTMWDVLSWGGETQALIYNPNTGKVVGLTSTRCHDHNSATDATQTRLAALDKPANGRREVRH